MQREPEEGMISRPLPSKPERIPHECVPVPGEFGRYYVKSRSAAKQGKDETYIVDVLEEGGYHGDGESIVGICPCKGYQVRKTCTHLDDAKAEHERREAPF